MGETSGARLGVCMCVCACVCVRGWGGGFRDVLIYIGFGLSDDSQILRPLESVLSSNVLVFFSFHSLFLASCSGRQETDKHETSG